MKRTIVLALALALCLGNFSGCGPKQEDYDGIGAEVKLNGDAVYPVECDDTLTYWMILNSNVSPFAENFGDTPIGKEMEKLSGIKVEYIHPQVGQQTEQLNILMASDELPDMVQHQWNSYAGGPDRAIEDEMIISLNELMPKYAPEMYQAFTETDERRRQITSNNGNFYTVAPINEVVWTRTYFGWILRRDWLEKSGLDVPKSVDEFEKVLYAFKEYSDGEPFFLDPYYRNKFLHMFDIGGENDGQDFYVEDGVVKYAPAQERFKDAVLRLNKWKKDGILDVNYTSGDTSYQTAAILNSKTGAFLGASVSGIAARLDAKPAEVPEFDLIGIPPVSLTGEGRGAYDSPIDEVGIAHGTAISKKCKNYELAMRFLNFGYTEAGRRLNNYGIEGITYEMVDDKVQFTDFMLNNPDGHTINEVAAMYTRASYAAPFVCDDEYVKISQRYPQQLEAYENWSMYTGEHKYPTGASVTLEEAERAAEIQTNLTTYVDEMFVKFIDGTEPLDKIDEFYKQLEKFGLNELLEMKQSAYERYMSK